MDDIKIKNLGTRRPGLDLPAIRHLGREECESLLKELTARLEMPDGSSALAILKVLELGASDIPHVKPSDDGFVLSELLNRLQFEPANIYINWSSFDDIDEMSTVQFSAVFHDLWYPSSDDIEIFDRSHDWVLLIRHFDVVQLLRI